MMPRLSLRPAAFEDWVLHIISKIPEIISVLSVFGAVGIYVYVVPICEDTAAPVGRRCDQCRLSFGGYAGLCVIFGAGSLAAS